MQIYQRGDKYLVILPNLPQWFVVDEFGKAVAELINIGASLDEVVQAHPDCSFNEINQTYNEILSVVKPFDNPIEDASIETSLTAKSTVAMICLTRRCNLECPHCYVDALGFRGDELTIDEHRRIAFDLRENMAIDPGIKYKVNLTGGEPFLRQDIMEIISIYHDNEFGVTMSTNGLLINRSHLTGLRKNDVALSISLDGATAATHDFVRGQGSFQTTTENIKMLTSSGVKVSVNCLVHEDNLSELEDLINLAFSLGCNGFNPINLVQLGRACDSSLKRVSEVFLFRRIAEHLKVRPEMSKMFSFSSLFGSLGSALLTGIACVNCGLGSRPCAYISELGDIYPCPNTQKKEFLLGNVRSDVVASCLNTEHNVYKMFADININTMNGKCGACDVRYFCGGDCRGETYNVTGQLFAPYVACDDRHDSLIELMWIVSEMPQVFEARSDEYISHSRGV